MYCVLHSARVHEAPRFASAREAARHISDRRIADGWDDGDHTGTEADIDLIEQAMGAADVDGERYTIIALLPLECQLETVAARIDALLRARMQARGKGEEVKEARARAQRILDVAGGTFTAAAIKAVYFTRTPSGWHVDVTHQWVDWPSLSTSVSHEELI